MDSLVLLYGWCARKRGPILREVCAFYPRREKDLSIFLATKWAKAKGKCHGMPRSGPRLKHRRNLYTGKHRMYGVRYNNQSICTNCGGQGHTFRQCIAPVTSYGVIMVRPEKGFDIASALSTNSGLVTGMENQKLEFLLIQRRDSLGFIELMRGRYKITDIDYIRLHMNGITQAERNKYCEGPFETLWTGMWGLDHSHLYKNE